ncbi:MAG: TonB-dependent receptor [Myxococcaceae bacterium]|nr:TonB-dependent receptor [Myxococcaceae bacterium]
MGGWFEATGVWGGRRWATTRPCAFRLRGGLGVVALGACLLASGPAFADARLEARRHFRAGMSLIGKGDYEAGIRELKAAYSTKPHPNVLFNIAHAYEDWGHLTDAIDWYQRYLAFDPPDAAAVQEAIARLEAKLIAAAPPSPPQPPPESPAPSAGTPAPALDPESLQRLTTLTERLEAAVAKAESLTSRRETASVVPSPSSQQATANEDVALDEDAADAPPYEEVLVTASRRTQSTLEAPYATTVITGEEIRLSGVTSLVELLRRVPGAEVMQLGIGSANVSFRGFNQRLANKVLVLIDGRTEYQDFLGLTLWSALPVGLDEIDRIEVIRGPGSALYGANAMLGVINIITRPPGTGPRGEFNATAGMGNRASGSFLASGGQNRLRYRASVAYDQGDKWSRDFADDRPDVQSTFPESSLGLRGVRGNFTATWQFSRELQLGASAGVNRLYTEVYPLGLLRNYAFDGLTAYAKSDLRAGPVKLKFFWNHLATTAGPQYEPRGEPSLLTHVQSNVFDLEALFSQELELLGPHQLIIGASGRLKHVVWDYLDGTHQELHAAAFVQDEWRILDPLRVVASWRIDRHPLLDSGKPGFAQSPRVSAVYIPFEGHALRASFATAFREPTYLESYTAVRIPIPGVNAASALTVGNTELRPERLIAYELGYRGERVSWGLEWDLALYQNEVKDLIVLSNLQPLPADQAYDPVSDTYLLGRSRFANEQGLYTARGVELGVRYSPVDRVDVRASTAVQRVTASGLPEGTACAPCTQAPTYKIQAGASWRSPAHFDFSVDAAYTSSTTWIEREPAATDPTRIENVSNPLPAYTVLNARVGYRLNENVEFAVAGTHLLDGHREHPFGNLIERRVFASVRVTP